METLALTDRIRTMLLGVKIGDRWGLPVECLTRAEIIKRTHGFGVTKLEDVRDWRADLNAPTFAMASDDWQQTSGVGWCFVRHPHATPEHMARALVQMMHDSIEGWGGTTLNSVRELEQWLSTKGKMGRAPTKPPTRPMRPGNGAGCGAAMRIAPLATVCTLRGFNNAQVVEACIEHGKLTHPDPRAWIGAAALALQLVWLMRGEEPGDEKGWLLRLVGALGDRERECIDEYGGLPESEPRICQVLRYIAENGLVYDRDRLLAEVGNECPTFQSVPFAIATFLRCRTSFRAGILEAINDGGDADSVASMVGASLGAHLGLKAIPSDWIRPEDGDAHRLAYELVTSISNAHQVA